MSYSVIEHNFTGCWHFRAADEHIVPQGPRQSQVIAKEDDEGTRFTGTNGSPRSANWDR